MGEARLALLSLGANHEADVNLPRAAGRVAGVYETPPISGAGANYLNAALAVRSDLDGGALRATCKAIERELGRAPTPSTDAAPIPIDIDVCVIPPMAASSDTLRVGHLAALLAEVAPEMTHPTTGEPLATIAERLGGGVSMTPRPDVDAAMQRAMAR